MQQAGFGGLDQTRRRLFKSSALGLAPMALASLLSDERRGVAADGPWAARRPHVPPRARSVIFLCQIGGPSQLDLFDPKPELLRRAGQPLPESIRKRMVLMHHEDDVTEHREQVEALGFRLGFPGDCYDLVTGEKIEG